MRWKLGQSFTRGTWLMRYLWLGFLLCCLVGSDLFISRSDARQSQYFDYPESMVIYRNGLTEQLNATSPRYSKIYQQLQQRIHEPLYVAKLAAIPQVLEQIKKTELAVEFKYSKLQSSTYLVHKSYQRFTYTRLLFPLTGTYSELFFLGDTKGYYSGPLGQLLPPEDLTKY